jgi:hypothetical protein
VIDKSQAIAIATERVSAMRIGRRRDLALQQDRTMDTSFGWVFFYDSFRYLETGDRRFAAIGNSPLMIDRRDGNVYVAGTARPIDFYIREYERSQNLKPLPKTASA